MTDPVRQETPRENTVCSDPDHPIVKRSDRLIGSLLVAVFGACGGGAIAWMMEVGTGWIIVSVVVGYLLTMLFGWLVWPISQYRLQRYGAARRPTDGAPAPTDAAVIALDPILGVIPVTIMWSVGGLLGGVLIGLGGKGGITATVIGGLIGLGVGTVFGCIVGISLGMFAVQVNRIATRSYTGAAGRMLVGGVYGAAFASIVAQLSTIYFNFDAEAWAWLVGTVLGALIALLTRIRRSTQSRSRPNGNTGSKGSG